MHSLYTDRGLRHSELRGDAYGWEILKMERKPARRSWRKNILGGGATESKGPEAVENQDARNISSNGEVIGTC